MRDKRGAIRRIVERLSATLSVLHPSCIGLAVRLFASCRPGVCGVLAPRSDQLSNVRLWNSPGLSSFGRVVGGCYECLRAPSAANRSSQFLISRAPFLFLTVELLTPA
jgi:hypothetical protein